MAASDSGAPAKQGNGRPTLANTKRTSSYLREHQQYRPPNKPDNHFGIDTVVEDFKGAQITPPRQFSPFSGIPSPENPPKIVESGIIHDLSHANCMPPAGVRTNRLVATLMYKAQAPRASISAVPANNGANTQLPAPESDIPANMAPTTDREAFPLEPPADPEPLDHLYGSYISPLCITSFLHLMSTFPLPPGSTDLSSAHRCLDDPEHPLVVELTMSPGPSPDYLSTQELRKHELIYRFEREWHVDVVLQPDRLWRRYPRLVVFDMDSTLITQEVIDLLAASFQDQPEIGIKVAEITHRAMTGELEFDGAFRERVKLLAGMPVTLFEDLRSKLNVTKGVRELICALKRLGVKTAVLSGGFLPLTSWLASSLGIDHAHANEVVVDEAGKLTGEVKGTIVGKERKRDLLCQIAEQEGVELQQVVAVGDGANDLLMMAAAGLGVAWNAKPMVQLEAAARLNTDSLLDVLYLFGFTKEEIDMLASTRRP